MQVVNQLVGCGVAALLGIVGTLIALKVCDLMVGVRVDKKDEVTGLDVSMHGEEGYNFES
jgi:ammonium transporter, Amt family